MVKPLFSVEIDVSAQPDLSEDAFAHLSKLADEAIRAVLTLERYERDAEVSVLYTDDEFIAELNLRYRDVEGPTDVLSFALTEGEDGGDESNQDDDLDHIPVTLGDIIISLETAARQASVAGKETLDEVALLLVHGALHLLGYDHETPEKEAVMWERQAMALQAINRI